MGLTSGINSQKGKPGQSDSPPSRNCFTILNSCDDDNLETIALKCDVRLGRSQSEIQNNITAMKMEEVTRAKLAEANYTFHRDHNLAASHVLEGENLSLKTTDNLERGVPIQGVAKSPLEGGKEIS